jgi:hypothetical protein
LPAAAIAATVGAVVASRRPRHPVGWLLVGVGLSVAADGVSEGYTRYGLLARPGALPAADWVAVYSLAMFFLTLVCIGFTLLLTPSGSLPSPRWRWSARAAVANAVMFVLAQTFGPVMLSPYESVAKPLAVPALAGIWTSSPGSPTGSPPSAWRSGPGRWWSAFGGPVAWNASSCAGLPSGPP